MQHMSKTNSPPIKQRRVSVPVDADVLLTFQRLAAARSVSTGRAMGEWLEDTIDAARYMAETLEKARSAPKLVAQELHAYAIGLGDETGRFLQAIRDKGRAAQRPSQAEPGSGGGAIGNFPPSCNTGGKFPSPRNPPRAGGSV